MAKIPSFTGNNRIQPGPLQDIENPREARRQSEALVGFGQDVQQFGSSIDQYYQKRKQVDNALFAAQFEEKALQADAEAQKFARTNPQSAKDGSTVQNDYLSMFGNIREAAKEIKDPEQKAIALKTANQIEKRSRSQLLGFAIEKHNGYVLEASNDLLNDMSFRVQQDPTQLTEALTKFNEYADKMPYVGKDSEKFRRTGERSLVVSALESYAAQGQYKAAKELLNNTQAGAFFSVEERKKLSDEYDQRYVKQFRDMDTLDRIEHNRMKREKELVQERTELQIFERLVTSNAPTDRQAVIKEAELARSKGLISRSGYNAILARQDDINLDSSNSLTTQHLVSYYKGTTPEKIKQNVVSDMAAGRIRHQEGSALIAKITAQAKREQSDPKYKRQEDLAKTIIKGRVQGTQGMFGIIYGQAEQQTLADIYEEKAKLQEQGMDPVTAAKMASAKVIGLEQFSNVTTQQMQSINNDPKSLISFQSQVLADMEEKKRQNKLTPDAKRRYLEQLKAIDMRLEKLKMDQEYEALRKFSAPVKEGE